MSLQATRIGEARPFSRRRVRVPWGRWGLRWVAIGYLGVAILLPLSAILKSGLSDGLRTFWRDVTNPMAFAALKLTILVAVITTVINLVMGTLTAYVLERYEFPGRRLLNSIIDLPFAIPTLVTGVMLVLLYGPQSTLGAWLSSKGIQVIFNTPGIVVALLLVTYPFVIRAVQPVLRELDRSQEEAAYTIGATKWTIFRTIILPAISPAIITGALLSFARALGEFGSIVVVAGNIPGRTLTAPVYVYGQLESYNQRGASAVSVVLLALSFTLMLLVDWMQKRWDIQAETVGAARARTKRPGLIEWSLIGIGLFYATVLLAGPLVAMTWGAFSEGLTTFWAQITSANALSALKLTLLLGAGATLINAILGVCIAWVLVRDDFKGKRFINGMVDLPFAVSPVIAGLMVILLFGRGGWFTPATDALGVKIVFAWPGMLLATVFISLPFIIREVMPVLAQVGVEQEQAAYTMGATGLQAFRHITLPSIKWGLFYGISLTLARSIGEFGTVLVVSGGVSGLTETSTLFIFRSLDDRNYTAAYATSLLLACITFIIFIMMEFFRREVMTHDGAAEGV
ncbi:MAG TPA: sulfate ABC transporter permease subunit CysT [Pyrinomonadaceae bacterium]